MSGLQIFRYLPSKQERGNHAVGPALIVIGKDFRWLWDAYYRLLCIKSFLDQVQEEFINAQNIYFLPMSDAAYCLVVAYREEESNIQRLLDIDKLKLTDEQTVHLTREMIEILLNLNSNNATCNVVNEDCFLLVKNKDVKLDLFYLALFQDIHLTQPVDTTQQSDQEESELDTISFQSMEPNLKNEQPSNQIWFGIQIKYIPHELKPSSIFNKPLKATMMLDSDKCRVYSLGVILSSLNEHVLNSDLYYMIEKQMLVPYYARYGSIDLLDNEFLSQDREKSMNDIADIVYKHQTTPISKIFGEPFLLEMNDFSENAELEELFDSLERQQAYPTVRTSHHKTWQLLNNAYQLAQGQVDLGCNQACEQYLKKRIAKVIQRTESWQLLTVGIIQEYWEDLQAKKSGTDLMYSVELKFLLQLLQHQDTQLSCKVLALQLLALAGLNPTTLNNITKVLTSKHFQLLITSNIQNKPLVIMMLRLAQVLSTKLKLSGIMPTLAQLYYQYSNKNCYDIRIEILLTISEVANHTVSWYKDFIESGFISICKQCLTITHLSSHNSYRAGTQSSFRTHRDQEQVKEQQTQVNSIASTVLFEYAVESGNVDLVNFVKANTVNREIIEIVKSDLKLTQE